MKRILTVAIALALCACANQSPTSLLPHASLAHAAPLTKASLQVSAPFTAFARPSSYAPFTTHARNGRGGTQCHYIGWVFTGPCVTKKAKTAVMLTFRSYKTITRAQITYQSVTVAKPSPLTIVEATGNGDITGTLSGASFPLGGTSYVAYYEIVNANTVPFTFATSPMLTLKMKTWPSTVCTLMWLNGPPGSASWVSSGISGNVIHGVLTLPDEQYYPVNTLSPQAVEFSAIAC